MPLRVGYVREHFSSPLLQYAAADGGRTFVLVECPSGTGQLITRLEKDEIDVAIALTDPLISGIAKGSTAYKLVGSYVATPLNWAVIVGTDSKYHSMADLKGAPIGISRPGSGSQTMAFVMALQQGWPTAELSFQVNNDIRGLLDAVNAGTSGAFMWEWFTTKPFADAGECRFVGSVPTPWPSWLIAAHPARAGTAELRTFLTTLSGYVREFDSAEKREKENVKYIVDTWDYKEEDVKAWLETVKYPAACDEIPTKVITDTLSVFEQAGFITPPAGGWDAKHFVNEAIVKLT